MDTLAPAPGDSRVATQLQLLAAVREMTGAGHPPAYFAHMRLESGGRTSDILLGSARRLGQGVSIIDWQTAPLAQVFFMCEEGEHYEVEIDGRALEGTLVERNLLSFEGKELVRIEWE